MINTQVKIWRIQQARTTKVTKPNAKNVPGVKIQNMSQMKIYEKQIHREVKS